MVLFLLSVELCDLRHVILDLLDGLVSIDSRYHLYTAVAFLYHSVDHHELEAVVIHQQYLYGELVILKLALGIN